MLVPSQVMQSDGGAMNLDQSDSYKIDLVTKLIGKIKDSQNMQKQYMKMLISSKLKIEEKEMKSK
jgi:hypothetical protein